ncbi:MAG: 50S ribosome-binding GTPase [Lactobacillales bacterium]|nr:50S ribosome-binding GTPase [Lactobacillales bacterium]
MSKPMGLRKHVAIVGKTNAGKSTLFNLLTGQDNAIVSAVAGTTTDPVNKAMELLGYGPIVLIDTAGLGDTTELGGARIGKTEKVLRRCDAAILVGDVDVELKLPHLIVKKNEFNYEKIIADLGRLLSEQEDEDKSILGGLVEPGANVILVMPIDSEAPKGRIILPQMQVLRDCLDNGIASMVVTEKELPAALKSLDKVDLVVTDSQVFKYVNEVTPEGIPVTSFSMLLAHNKANFNELLNGARALDDLPASGKILMLEGCTHNSTHEDIGRVKIPKWLKEKTGGDYEFEFRTGYDFPDDHAEYIAAIMCGGCMLNRRELLNRIAELKTSGVPVTNYGMFIAWATDTLERTVEIFDER